jgi:sensor histidine kinase YesM
MEQDTTLKEEIEIVDNYIYIINVRMTGDIHFRKEVPEGLADVMVPSMILQPVVENAVKHGISGMDSDGEIVLTVTEEEKNITITIKDNGIGMSMDKIEEVLSDGPVSSETGDSTGIGLNNVRNRLMLYYGSENLMTIQSDGINRGTEVKIIIPGRGNTRQGGVNYVSNSNRR